MRKLVYRNISVCILTKNAEETLKKTLDSIRLFDEIILIDTGSTDNTIELAQSYPNVTIFQKPFNGFGNLRNLAASLAKNDWILALDSDEVLSDFFEEVQTISLSPDYCYSFPRLNYYRGKQIKGCGWHPERVSRLYHKKYTSFSDAQVHESLNSKKIFPLNSPIFHTPYRSTQDFLQKMQHYSTLFAEQYAGIKKSSLFKALWKGAFSFFRSYLWKRGIFDGAEGIIISLYNANTTFYKYLKLSEINSKIENKNK